MGKISQSRQRSGKARSRTKTTLAGASMIALLAAPLAGSAAMDGGRFFVHAWNVTEPVIEATAGLGGLSVGGGAGGGQPGGGTGPETEQPTFLDDRATESLSCGTETVSVSDQMLKFSDENRAAVASGGEAKIWPGGDWKFIETSAQISKDTGSWMPVEPSIDRLYMFTSQLGNGVQDYITVLPSERPEVRDSAGNLSQVGEYENTLFSGARGSSPSIITLTKFEIEGDSLETCMYLKFENGRISSSSEAPAFYNTANYMLSGVESHNRNTFYAKNGNPGRTDSPSHIWDSTADGDSFFRETTFFPSNGERWDYADFKGATWHPSKQSLTTTHPNVASSDITWQNCLGDACETRLDRPTVALKVDRIATNGAYGGKAFYRTYSAPSGAGKGFNSIVYIENEDKSKSYVQYKTGLDFSRTDGPAILTKDSSGKLENAQYYINGKYYGTEQEYRAAGGDGWIGTWF